MFWLQITAAILAMGLFFYLIAALLYPENLS